MFVHKFIPLKNAQAIAILDISIAESSIVIFRNSILFIIIIGVIAHPKSKLKVKD